MIGLVFVNGCTRKINVSDLLQILLLILTKLNLLSANPTKWANTHELF